MKALFTLLLTGFVALLIAQPTNDECANAINISSVEAYCSGTDEFTTTDATMSAGFGTPMLCSPTWDGDQNDVWFTFSTTATIIDISISVNGAMLQQPQIAVYRGDCGGFAELACIQGATEESSVTLNVLALDPSETYYLRINAATTGSDGDFQLCIDEFSSNIITNVTTTECTGLLYDTGGPDGNYGAFESFQYTICPTDPHDCIAITLIEYDIEPVLDNLSIYDGANNTAPLIESIDGQSNGQQTFVPVETTGCITIEFTSDGGVFRSGFELTWECTQGGCPGPPPDFITCSGTFYDSGGPDGNYANNEVEEYIICPDSAYSCLNLTFVEYDIESFFDFINIYEGQGIDNGTYLGTFDGLGGGITFYNEGCLTIEFQSDSYANNPGWEATWECTQEMCPPDGSDIDYPDLTDCSGTFFDSGGEDGNYLNNENWNFSICPADTSMCIILNVNSYELPSDNDVLTIYDGPDIDGTILGQYFVSGTNDEIQTPSSCVTIAFQSNVFLTSGGFDISWQCTQEECTIDTPIKVDTTVTANDLADVIAADGVVISNVTLNCPGGSYGTFNTPGNCNIGMENGIILTNGSAEDAEGPDSSGSTSTDLPSGGDTDLDELLSQDGSYFMTQDACILEFDVFAPTNMLSFNYSFGSEEYPEFAPPNNTTYNDVFGFFISGPGISGDFTDDAINIALIPGTTTPVSINNLNAATNSEYYIDNQEGLCIEYDAFTSVLTASADVIACETYHIKLAVADVGDGIYDSGVFIQAQSLSTGAASISPTYEYSPDIDVAIEGCATGFFNIILDGVQTDTTVIYISVGGTATNGEDFATIPDSLIFYPGDTVLTIPVNPIEDGIIEGVEEAIIYLTTPTDCGNIQTDSAVVVMQDFIDLTLVPESPFITCDNATFEITANNAINYQWSTGDTTASIMVTATENTTYYVTGTVGNCTVEDSIEIIISELEIETTSIAISCFENAGSITTNINGGIAPFTYEWNDTNIGDTQNPTDLAEGTYTVTVTDANDCTGTSSVEIMTLDPLVLNVQQDTTETCEGNNAQATVTIVGQPMGDFETTYAWDDGQNTATAIGLSQGNHTITVTLTDTLGNTCSETGMINISTMPSIIIELVTTPEDCNEGGEIAVVITTGIPPFEYSIDGMTFQSDSIFTGLAAGDYTVIAQDSNGCTATAQAMIDPPPIPTLTATSDEATCGNNNGTITLIASGGIAPYQYSIDNCATFQTSPLFLGLAAGTYTVCVLDAAGCQATNVINVIETAPLQINILNSYSTGCGEETATIVVDDVTGGVQNYEYSANGGTDFQDSNTFMLAPGMYNIVVRDADGCTATLLITVTAFPGPIITANLDNPSSCGETDGTIQIFANGGVPPLQYSNNGGTDYQISPIFTGLGAASYTLVVGDAGGCFDTLMVNLTEPNAPVIDSIYAENPICSENNGSIEILIGAGNPNFEYSIDNGVTFQGSNTFENLPAGEYEIIVEDFLGCRITSMVTLTQAGAPEIANLEATPATCGDDNATLDVTVNGGTVPYIYSINGVNFQTENNFFNISPGVYTLTVRDSVGCVTEVLTQIITTGSLIIGNIETSNPSSCDVLDGAINIFVNGGTPPYEFSIDNGTTTQPEGLFTDLDAGEYNVIITDINGCAAVQVVQLATYNNPQITNIEVENTKCDEDEGSIIISVTGGTPNYQYSIDGGATYQGGNSYTGLPGGVYSVIVEDFTGCQITSEVTINSTDAPTISDLILRDPACGDENGTITISVTGGTAAYEYSINGGTTFQSATVFNDLAGGIYDIVVRDSEGCESYDQVILADEGALNIGAIDIDDSICAGENGVLNVFANGGTLPYQYSVDNGTNFQTGNVFSGLPPGTYNVVVTDANECTALQTVNINSFGVPQIDDVILIAATCGESDGSIEIVASSGAPAYQYSINNGTDFQSSNTFTGLAAGTYDVIIEDAVGCQASTQVEILPTTAAAPQITTDGPTDFCFYENITLNAGNFASYTWSSGEETQNITTNEAGTYFVTVTDSEGCIGIGEITLNVTSEFTVDAGEDMTVGLQEDFDLSVVFNDPDFTYSWTGSNGTSANGADVTFTANQVGTFTYTVTANADGCEVTDQVTITIEDRSSYDVPNAFSPNDDNLNEIFRLVKTESVDILQFKVFNRWGEMVYDSPVGEWDGKFRGQDQVADVYAYYIVIRLPNTEQVELKGDVLLMR